MSKLNDLFHKLKAIALKEGDDSLTYSIIYFHESNEDALQIFKTSNQAQCLSEDLVNKILDKKWDFIDKIIMNENIYSILNRILL